MAWLGRLFGGAAREGAEATATAGARAAAKVGQEFAEEGLEAGAKSVAGSAAKTAATTTTATAAPVIANRSLLSVLPGAAGALTIADIFNNPLGVVPSLSSLIGSQRPASDNIPKGDVQDETTSPEAQIPQTDAPIPTPTVPISPPKQRNPWGTLSISSHNSLANHLG